MIKVQAYEKSRIRFAKSDRLRLKNLTDWRIIGPYSISGGIRNGQAELQAADH